MSEGSLYDTMIIPADAIPVYAELFGWDWGELGIRLRGLRLYDSKKKRILDLLG